jgi:hypothetical protein
MCVTAQLDQEGAHPTEPSAQSDSASSQSDRNAVLADLDNLTGDTWHNLSLARRRALLAEFVQQVWVNSADIPVDRRVHIVG